MAYSEAQKRATLKYRAENIARITLDLKPDERDAIKAAAAAAGKSVKTYIVDLVRADTAKRHD